MKSVPPKEDVELSAIAALATYPSYALRAAERIGLVREDFADPQYAECFARILASEQQDSAITLEAYEYVKDRVKSMDEFLNLIPVKAYVDHALLELARGAIRRRAAQQTMLVYQDASIPPSAILAQLDKISKDAADRLAAIDRYQGNALVEDAEAERDGEFPEELMHVPGFVDAYADYIYRVSARPNKVLSFAGALAMMSHLAGRKFIGSGGATPNVYLVALANSGVGKDAPRKANKALADVCEAIDTVAEQIGSGQGLEDALFECPSTLFQMDEFDTVLNAMKEKGSISEHLYTYLLNFFSEASTTHALRKKMKSEAEKQALMVSSATGKRPALKIFYPTLTLFATAIPDRFYSALTLRALENGLLARCLVIEATKRGAANPNADRASIAFPDIVLDCARTLFERGCRQPITEKPSLHVVPYAEGAVDFKNSLNDEADRLYASCEKKNDRAGMAVWNRVLEIAERLALVYAISENFYAPKVTVAALDWAWKVVLHSARRMLSMVDSYVVDGRVEQNAMAVYRYLMRAENRKKPVARTLLGNNTHLSKKDLDEAIETLVDRDMVDVIKGRRNMTLYRAKSTKGRK